MGRGSRRQGHNKVSRTGDCQHSTAHQEKNQAPQFVVCPAHNVLSPVCLFLRFHAPRGVAGCRAAATAELRKQDPQVTGSSSGQVLVLPLCLLSLPWTPRQDSCPVFWGCSPRGFPVLKVSASEFREFVPLCVYKRIYVCVHVYRCMCILYCIFVCLRMCPCVFAYARV